MAKRRRRATRRRRKSNVLVPLILYLLWPWK
jgi:hypothetical protein